MFEFMAWDTPVLHVMDPILCEVNNTQPEYVEFQPCSLTSSSTSETLATPGRVPGCRCTRLEQSNGTAYGTYYSTNGRLAEVPTAPCWGLPRGGIGTRVERAELGLDA